MITNIDSFFSAAKKWQKEFGLLRSIPLDCGLTEELKWGKPCYTLQERNIVLIHGFKEYCAFLFFKGAILQDTNKILIQQTKNVQAARQIRFSNEAQIVKLTPLLKAYILEAIAVENPGVKVNIKQTSEYEMPHEFKSKLTETPALKLAFEKLTPGRQRGYLLHFSSPKQSKTRETRIEKCIQQILHGKGLTD